MKLTNATFFLVALSLLAVARPIEAKLYKCIDAAGRVTYQQSSCPETAITATVPEVSSPAGIGAYHGTQAPGDYLSTKQRKRQVAKPKKRSSNCYRVKTKHGTRCLTASERRKKARALRWEMEGLKTKAIRSQQIYGRPGGIYMPEVKTRGENGRTLRELRRERDALLEGINPGREGGYEK